MALTMIASLTLLMLLFGDAKAADKSLFKMFVDYRRSLGTGLAEFGDPAFFSRASMESSLRDFRTTAVSAEPGDAAEVLMVAMSVAFSVDCVYHYRVVEEGAARATLLMLATSLAMPQRPHIVEIDYVQEGARWRIERLRSDYTSRSVSKWPLKSRLVGSFQPIQRVNSRNEETYRQLFGLESSDPAPRPLTTVCTPTLVLGHEQ